MGPRLAAGNLSIRVAGALLVDVADGNDLHAQITEGAAHVVEALDTDDDDAERDPLTRNGPLLTRENGGTENDRCHRCSHRRLPKEAPPSHGSIATHEEFHRKCESRGL